jgi:hypothetical protein
MAGLAPAIHVFPAVCEAKTWMPGTRPGMTTNLPSRISRPEVVLRLPNVKKRSQP